VSPTTYPSERSLPRGPFLVRGLIGLLADLRGPAEMDRGIW